ncbi:hypothetical protein BVRB_7g159830 [Beta vulgaris subsp. vulgaris]|nr:hypothetical protein BVRB_7g159830 [Beta vulgaris subsp. vulgaris]
MMYMYCSLNHLNRQLLSCQLTNRRLRIPMKMTVSPPLRRHFYSLHKKTQNFSISGQKKGFTMREEKLREKND